jgi:hypothetical protein
MLASSVSVVVEANFFRYQEADFTALPAHRLMQLHCEAPLPILVERCANRSRHAGHQDAEKIKELPSRFESRVHSPLRLDELIQLDTTRLLEFATACDVLA